MNLINPEKNMCRICLKDNVFFEWTEAIFEFYGPSYKECYYQYTHLPQEEDVYTQMLCLDCGNGLRNTYQLVERALISLKKLKELKPCSKVDNVFEVYEIERVVSPYVEDPLNAKAEHQELSKSIANTIQDNEDFESDSGKSPEINIDSEVPAEINEDNELQTELNEDNEIQTKKKEKPLLMCCVCSKLFYHQYKLKEHETIHHEKRERNVACPICGLKFYNKMTMRPHMETHDKNRIRKKKCEFCDKSFLNNSALNVHRRIHVGPKLKCHICPKEYIRQVDLDRHLQSHDIMPATGSGEKPKKIRTKYYLKCDTCGKKMQRQYYEDHKAKHLNQPQHQCSICSKFYFTRDSVVRHLAKYHDIKSEYGKFVNKLNNFVVPRITRLMVEQRKSLIKDYNITVQEKLVE